MEQSTHFYNSDTYTQISIKMNKPLQKIPVLIIVLLHKFNTIQS